jgi:hypothetical protein
MAPRYYAMSTNVKPKPVWLLVWKQLEDLPTVVVKLRLTNSSHRNETFDERELRTAPMGGASKGKGPRLGLSVKRTSGADAGPVRLRYYGGAVSAHTATRGLFTGIWLRHVAARSVGMIARFRLGPQ